MVSATGVCLVNGELRAVQHGKAEDGFGIVFDWGHETDGNFAQLGGVAVGPILCRAVIGKRIGLDEPVVIRLCKAPVGHCFIRHVSVAWRRLVVVRLFVRAGLRPSRTGQHEERESKDDSSNHGFSVAPFTDRSQESEVRSQESE